MKRKAEIEAHLSALEAPEVNSRMASWEAATICRYRITFDRTGDLNDREFETLEKIRHRVCPPKLGSNGKDADKAKATSSLSIIYVEIPLYGLRLPIRLFGGNLFSVTLEMPGGFKTHWVSDDVTELQDRVQKSVLASWSTKEKFDEAMGRVHKPETLGVDLPVGKYFGTSDFWSRHYDRLVRQDAKPWYTSSGYVFYDLADTVGTRKLDFTLLERLSLRRETGDKSHSHQKAPGHPEFLNDRH